MNNKTSNSVYEDLKRIIKKCLKVLVILILLIVFAITIYFAKEYFNNQSREAVLLQKAKEQVENLTPLAFKRTSLGETSSLFVWFLNDTDRHIVVNKDGEFSLFTSRIAYDGDLTTHHKAGEACSTLRFKLEGNFLASVDCDWVVYLSRKQPSQ